MLSIHVFRAVLFPRSALSAILSNVKELGSRFCHIFFYLMPYRLVEPSGLGNSLCVRFLFMLRIL